MFSVFFCKDRSTHFDPQLLPQAARGSLLPERETETELWESLSKSEEAEKISLTGHLHSNKIRVLNEKKTLTAKSSVHACRI